MTHEDYSHEEIANVCKELIDLHSDKLKGEEILFIKTAQCANSIGKINQTSRDTLIAMYDRLKQI